MTGPLRTADSILPDPHDLDQALVLAGRPLRPGVVLEDTARFGDEVWALSPAQHQRHQRALILNFTLFPVGYRLAVKHLCFAMLSKPLPHNESRPNLQSIRRHLVEIKRFLIWLVDHADRTRGGELALREVTREDLTAYAVHLTSTVRSEASREVAQVAVRLFWRYRTVLPAEHHLAVDPLDVDGWATATAAG